MTSPVLYVMIELLNDYSTNNTYKNTINRIYDIVSDFVIGTKVESRAFMGSEFELRESILKRKIEIKHLYSITECRQSTDLPDSQK